MPLECLAVLEEGLRAFAMGRMLAEQDSGVNGCDTDVNVGDLQGPGASGVTERRHGPKIGRGVRGRIADTVGAAQEGDTRGGKIGLPAPRML